MFSMAVVIVCDRLAPSITGMPATAEFIAQGAKAVANVKATLAAEVFEVNVCKIKILYFLIDPMAVAFDTCVRLLEFSFFHS